MKRSANAPSWISVSIAMARKRLPIPARGNSSGVCSGVSMVSLSSTGGEPEGNWPLLEATDDLLTLAAQTPALLVAPGKPGQARRPRRRAQRYQHPLPPGIAGTRTALPPDGLGPGHRARGSRQPATSDISQPLAGPCAQPDLHRPAPFPDGHCALLHAHISTVVSRHVASDASGIRGVSVRCAAGFPGRGARPGVSPLSAGAG